MSLRGQRVMAGRVVDTEQFQSLPRGARLLSEDALAPLGSNVGVHQPGGESLAPRQLEEEETSPHPGGGPHALLSEGRERLIHQ